MASIPTVPGSESVSTPSASIKLDFNALNAPNRASQELGDAFGDVGGQVAQVAQQLQAVKNFGIVADADRAMRRATADFQMSREGKTDEDQWGQEWKDRAAAVQDDIMNRPGVGPDVRRQLSNNLKNWNQSNAIEVQTVARKQMINRAVAKADGLVNDAIEDGGHDAESVIDAAYDPLVGMGAAYKETIDNKKKAALQKLDYNRATNAIASNPAYAVSVLKSDPEIFSGLTPQMRKIKLREARTALNTRQGENLEQWTQAVDAGIMLTEDELKKRLDTEEFSMKQVIGYRAYIKSRSGEVRSEEIPGLTREVRKMIKDMPQNMKSEDRESLKQDIMSSAQYLKLTPDLRDSFKAQMDAPKNAINGRVAKEIFQDIDRRFTAGVYGDYTTTYRDPVTYEWKTKKDLRLLEEATDRANAAEDFATKLFEKNPDISQRDANAAVAEFQSKLTHKSNRNIILKFTGSAPFPASDAEKKSRLDAILGKK